MANLKAAKTQREMASSAERVAAKAPAHLPKQREMFLALARAHRAAAERLERGGD